MTDKDKQIIIENKTKYKIDNELNIQKDQKLIENIIFINLKILSNIKEYDKLIFDKETEIVTLDNYDYTQPVRRWWCARSRKQTIEFLQNFIYNRVFVLIDKTLSNNKENTEYFKESNNNKLQKCMMELTNCLKGLNNLKLSYGSDVTFKSQIDVIIEDIYQRNEKISNILTISK